MSAKTTATATVKAGKKVGESVSTPIKQLGVCSTCRHLDRCLFVKAARQPIWSCEEFDSSGAATSGAARTLPQPRPVNLGEGQAEGLCVNCEVRTGCALRKPGVTVVECESYS
jgi:hypothetical protein